VVKPNETWASHEDLTAITQPDSLRAVLRYIGFRMEGVQHLWEAARLSVGEAELSRMKFPAMDIDKAFAVFTKAAYGKSLYLDHA
jgi:hypothetical protein